jgi:hypothetical protein
MELLYAPSRDHACALPSQRTHPVGTVLECEMCCQVWELAFAGVPFWRPSSKRPGSGQSPDMQSLLAQFVSLLEGATQAVRSIAEVIPPTTAPAAAPAVSGSNDRHPQGEGATVV